jgi:molecular chaperone DnaK
MGVAIGIDLGTTNSVAAIDDGKTHTLPTRMNERLTPSVVSFRAARQGRPGQILVGRAAVNNAANAADQTIFSIKRLMGLAIDDDLVVQASKYYPYTIVGADQPDDRGVRVVLNDQKYTPVEISSMILQQVVEDAKQALGADITHAIITVPAYFNEAQRAATREAGLQAGLKVKRIIDEPTAAAIAFGVDQGQDRHRVLVYDLGGGTFDISVIQMVDQKYEVLEMDGDKWLGGDDFDRQIVNLLIKWVKENYNDFDPSGDKRFLMLAKQNAERAKIALSGQDEFDVIIPAATRTSDGEMVDIEMSVTRTEFEQMIKPMVDRTIELVRGVLARQSLTVDDITTGLLVGGSTAVPLVYNMVAALFSKEKLRRHIDPMECVGIGAAILARRLDGVECPNCQATNPDDGQVCSACGVSLTNARSAGSIGLGEVTARSLGISVVGSDGRPGTFATIIPKGTPYPLIRPMERIFYTTSERMIRVPVYEGEDRQVSRNELQGMIEFELSHEIEPHTSVSVEFNYDKDRVLTVNIRVHGSDLVHHSALSRDRTQPKLDEERGTWREQLKSNANIAEYFVEEYREYLDSGTATKMTEDVSKARRAYAEQDQVVGPQVSEALAMAILGSGLASNLFLAERVMDGAAPEIAVKLAQAVRELKDAYRRRDRQRVEQISMAMQLAVARLLHERPSQAQLQGRDYDGLLRELN